MQGLDVFEYAIIRVVPRVERQEFINVGVILLCKPQKFLNTKILVNNDRLKAFGGIDCEEFEAYIHAFEKISAGEKNSGPIAQLPIADRFRWLTAARSTIVQTSHVHPGLCTNAQEKLDSIFEQLVR